MADLMDGDENLAVRAFLMLYGKPMLTVGEMQRHMIRSGFPHWPAWVEVGSTEHLAKAGAQQWLRHLFALEATPPAAASGQAAVQEVQPVAAYEVIQREHGGNVVREIPLNDPMRKALTLMRPASITGAAASQPSAQTGDALEVLRELVETCERKLRRLASGVISGKPVSLCGWHEDDLAPVLDRARKLVNGGAA